MSSEMIGEPPAITEDSDLADVIKELYRGRVGRNHKTSDYRVGGALCHYFLRWEEEWRSMRIGTFPFADTLAYDLEWIIRDHAPEPIQEHYFDVADVHDRDAPCFGSDHVNKVVYLVRNGVTGYPNLMFYP